MVNYRHEKQPKKGRALSDYNFDYGEIYALMRKFRDLTKDEVRILDYLMKRDYAELTYSGLTRELGLPNSCATNIRKAIINLQNIGIVCIINKYYEDEIPDNGINPMKACFIVDGWLNAFLGNGWIDFLNMED